MDHVFRLHDTNIDLVVEKPRDRSMVAHVS